MMGDHGQAGERRATVRGGAITLFHVRGIPVRVHGSWLVIFGLIAWSLAVGYFPRVLPDAPVAAHWVTGFVAALLLFVAVFLHELSHALVARRHGLGVSAITLHVFGGVSQLEEEPASPKVEILMALAGPVVSFAIAGLAYAGALLAAAMPFLQAVLAYLAFVNGIVGVFNLVPGFPLDGGRVLRAVLWRIRGDLESATQTATRAGTIVATFLVVLGVVRAVGGDFLGGLWSLLIGLFLRQAASGSYAQLTLRRTLEPFAVRDVMARDVVTLGPELSLERAVDEILWKHRVSSFPVLAGARVAGIVSLEQLREVPRERWAETTVEAVMLRIGPSLTIAPGASLWDAFQKLANNGLGRLAVMDGERLVGYVSVKDVVHVLTIGRARPRERMARTA
jgi:Zn-dependent protease/CBS domain-containing protein